jgi:HlyD family secretion protein
MHKRKWTFSAALLLLAFSSACTYPGDGPVVSRAVPTKAVRQDLRLVVNTNGIIEPMDPGEIYASTEGFVTALGKMEGAEVTRGELLMKLQSRQLLTALSEARSALLQARLEAQSVLAGPPKEELAAAEAAIGEADLQLQQRRDDLSREEALLGRNATTRQAVERLQKECHLLELRLEDLQKKKQALLDRYTPDQKQWQQEKVLELTRHVELLEDQIRMGEIHAPGSGVLYSLPVRTGSFVSRGQLLGKVYQPGRIRLRAYVDETDLGQVERNQPVLIEWDGLPGRQWEGAVERPADQVVPLGNRSVGEAICSISGEPKELIPNLNVRVQIVTAAKINALVIPRSAVFNYDGHPSVMVFVDGHTTVTAVKPGLVTPLEVEILQGIQEGSVVATNPAAISGPEGSARVTARN